MRIEALGAGLLTMLCAACGGGGASAGPVASFPATPERTGISILAGDPLAAGQVDASGSAARFNDPAGIALDPEGNLLVADRGNCTLRKITPTGTVSTVAGSAQRCANVDGAAASAGFARPFALAAARDGRAYVSDGLDVREVDRTGAIRTIFTLPTGSLAAGRRPEEFYGGGIAVDASGVNLVLTNGYGTRRIGPVNGSMATTAILEGTATRDNLFQNAYYLQRGVAIDSAGVVYVADLVNRVSRIDGAGKTQTLAGTSGASGTGDGTGGEARFQEVVGLALDAQGNLYAADKGNNLVRRITPAGVVTTVAGKAGANVLQTGALPGSLAALNGIATDGKGTLYATSGNAIVKIVLP